MICLTGNEPDAAALRARIEAHPQMLHEIRIDALDTADDVWPIVADHAAQLLLCCRPTRQGGRYDGDETDRIRILQQAFNAGARWVDVEDDVATDGFDRSRLVLSFHDFAGSGGDLMARARAMRPRCAVVKLAVCVNDAAELSLLRRVRHDVDGDMVLIGMGAAGVLSRSHYRTFGSRWTYVPAESRWTTAAGQLDLARARLMGLPDSADQPFLGLIGGPQIAHSPGVAVYNQLLRDRGSSMAYVPIVSQDLLRCLPLLEGLGARGLSVTMPLKAEALRCSEPDQVGVALGAVNSLRRIDDRWISTNSDVAGVLAPLKSAAAAGTALVLGAGGAASAAVAACRQLGLDVIISARRQQAAAALGEAVSWHQRDSVAADIIINATSVVGDDSPWPHGRFTAKVVFDLAIGTGSKLLADARSAGCETIDATAMWVHQGAAQMRFILGDETSADELQERLP